MSGKISQFFYSKEIDPYALKGALSIKNDLFILKEIKKMITPLLELLVFLNEYYPFIFSLFALTAIFLLLAKSIKKHAKIYYIILAIPAILCFIQYLNNIFELSSMNLYKIPVLGKIMAANIHMEGYGYPLLVIIMYIGALNWKNKYVKSLVNIRKELSIISGFPILAHSLIRVTYNFIYSIKFFAEKTDVTANSETTESLAGANLYNSGYLLGIVLVILFLLLWITSFDSVHKKLGELRWKKIQNWSYLLYALLFVHSILLHLGWMLDSENFKLINNDTISILSTVLIFGSYLFLRLRKIKIGKFNHQKIW